MSQTTTIGAWGGGGGGVWSFLPSGGGITKIIVRSGHVVDSIAFVSQDGSGKHMFSPNYGGGGGGVQEITLEWPSEYLTSISGTMGIFNGLQVVKSLEMSTNHGRRHGLFGRAGSDDTAFSFNMNGSAIVGFHGRCGLLLDSIGVYIRPTP